MSAALRSQVAFLLVVVLAAGCSSARVFQTSGPITPLEGVAEVLVVVDEDSLPNKNLSYYRSNSMSGAIRSALVKELKKRGKLNNRDVTLEFKVTDFRLRTGSQVFWFGVMAGSDYLAGTVTVSDETGVLKTFDASAKGLESLWSGLALFRLTAGRRADVFCKMIAKKVVKQL